MSLFGRSSQPESGPRSAEDRERARQEREARRAAREGRPAPAFPAVDDGTGDTFFTDEPAPRAEQPRVDAAEQPRWDAAPAAETPREEEPRRDAAAAAEAPREEEPRWDSAPAAEAPRAEDPRWESAAAAEAPRAADAPAAETPRWDAAAAAEASRAEEPSAVREDESWLADEPEWGERPAEQVELAGDILDAEEARAEAAPADEETPWTAPPMPDEPAWAQAAAESVAQEPHDEVANPGEVSDSRAVTSWFDDPAPAASPEPIAPDAGQPTVEYDVQAAHRVDTTRPDAPQPDRGATVQYDVEQALAQEEPRVTRRVPATAAAPAARAAAARANGTARYGDEHERPVAPKRVPRAGRTLPPPPPPPGEKRGKPGRRGRRIAVFVVLALILGAAGWLYSSLYEPFAGDAGERVRVEIPQQSTASDIGELLEREGVVASSTFFTLRSRLDGGDLKAGTYTLRRDMTYADAIQALSAGPPAAQTINLTIPEGRSRRETRTIIEDAGLRGSYLQASERSTGFNPRRYGAPRDLPSLEGFLFPATYELRPNATSRQLVRRQLEAFEEAIDGVDMRRARARNLDVYDVLIIASMVEREATLPRERRLIASVIYNRLRQGMPLGIDATIRFAVRNWSRPLRVSELETDSPYNTRKRTGLPPGPIGSPGLASIKAAANPASTDYLFYVVKPSGDGAHNFSSTDAEFQEDVAAYNRAREARGGQDPSSSDGG